LRLKRSRQSERARPTASCCKTRIEKYSLLLQASAPATRSSKLQILVVGYHHFVTDTGNSTTDRVKEHLITFWGGHSLVEERSDAGNPSWLPSAEVRALFAQAVLDLRHSRHSRN